MKTEKPIKRSEYVTLNIYMLCMLILDYFEDFKNLSVFTKRVKNKANLLVKELEAPIVNEINGIYNKSPEDYEYMIRRYNKLTKLISTYDPEELEDFIQIADSYKNNKPEFMKHFNIIKK